LGAAIFLLRVVRARASPGPSASAIGALVTFASYHQLASVLRWLTLSLFAYIATAFLVHPSWPVVALATLTPHVPSSRGELAILVALLGTTISPYLFFWQASEEVEEEIEMGRLTVQSRIGATRRELSATRADIVSGMAFSNLIAFFIILTTGATLHRTGSHTIATAADAAAALEPLAGSAAAIVFALGVFATGLLAVPVLAGSVAYALTEARDWKSGMSERPATAPQFYAVILCAIAAGGLISLLPVDGMKLLVWAAIVNGILAPPLIVLLLAICNDRRVMGENVNGVLLNTFGAIAAALMTAAAVALLFVS
jgi:Mn2+/Fe2+ NRAMP family transporter